MSGMILSPLPSPMVAATTLRLYSRADRADIPVDVPVTQQGAEWVAEPSSGVLGRFHPTLVGTDADGGDVTADLAYVDLPDDPELVVTPETIAARAKIPLPLAPDDRDVIRDAILDAQADVVAYLGRPITPTTYVERDRYAWPQGWDLVSAPDEPLIDVVSAVPQLDTYNAPTGYFTVTYVAGIDAKHDAALSPIRRFVKAHALRSGDVELLWKRVVQPAGTIKNVSAEGQSVTYDTPTLGGSNEGTAKGAGSGAPGSLPTLASLDRWRLAGRRVHVARGRAAEWPYTGRPLL